VGCPPRKNGGTGCADLSAAVHRLHGRSRDSGGGYDVPFVPDGDLLRGVWWQLPAPPLWAG